MMDISAICENVDWVGYVDWNMRDFHSFKTSRGVTYNSYLVRDDKTALIDTVKAPFAENLLENISALIFKKSLDYIVVNHAELDHSGSLAKVLERFPHATILCDKKCKEILSKLFNASNWKFQIIKSGDSVSLGENTLVFFETPMLHWPESMFTYIPEKKLLFSMDAFGQHYSSSNRFDYANDLNEIMGEAKKYYANIIMLYGASVIKTMEKISHLDIEIIAPSHGIIWRNYIKEILSSYRKWANFQAVGKVLVIYDSMWESTKIMGESILSGAASQGIEGKLIHLRSTTLTEIASEVLDSPTIAFGSATLNMGMMPMMGAALTYLKGLQPKNKFSFAFGSYGWGKGAPEDIHEHLQSMKWNLIREPLKALWKPNAQALDECYEAGKKLGEIAKKFIS